MSSKPASLGAGIVKKGEARPVVAEISPVAPAVVAAPVSEDKASAKAQAAGYYKALTVKLDRERYEALKAAGVKNDKRSQEIFVDALDAWLKVNA